MYLQSLTHECPQLATVVAAHVASNFYIAPCGQFFDDTFQELEFFNNIGAFETVAKRPN